MALWLMAASQVRAQTVTVTTTAGNGSAGSLGAALEQASSTTSIDQIAFGTLFSTPQTITLTGSYPNMVNYPLISGVTIAAPSLVTINDGGNTVFSLSGANTYDLGNLTLKGAGTGLAINGGVTLDISAPVTVNDLVTGTGGLTVEGTSTLALSGNNTYTGGTYINGSTLSISNNDNLGATGVGNDITIDNGTLVTTGGITTSRLVNINNATISVASGQTTVLNGVVSGSGGLTMAGQGTLALNGTNTYTGGTTIDSFSTLAVSSDSNLGDLNGVVNVNGALYASGSFASARTFNMNGIIEINQGTTLTITGTMNGSMTLDGIDTSSVLVINGTNNMTGMFLEDATISVANGAELGTSDAPLTAIDTLFNMTSGLTATQGLQILGDVSIDVAAGQTSTWAGQITGSGGLLVNGNLTITGTSNNYSGGTTDVGGTLTVSKDVNLGATGVGNGITLQNATLVATNGFTSSRAVNITAGTITVASGQTLTLTGVVSGTGDLTVTGPGNLALSGNNTYTGGTFIDGGTLSVSNNDNLGATGTGNDITIDNGTLVTTGGITTSRNVSINNATISVGIGQTTVLNGVVSGSGGLTMAGQGTLALNGTNTYTGGTTIDSFSTLAVSSDSNLGDLSGVVNVNGALFATSSFTTARTLNMNGIIEINPDTTLTISGTLNGSMTVDGIDTSSVLVINGTNNMTGMFIEDVTISIANGAELGTPDAPLTAIDTLFNMTSGLTATQGLQILGDVSIDVAAGQTSTWAGQITGSGGLLVNGNLTITGTDNNYSGGTTDIGGTLTVSKDVNLGTTGAGNGITLQNATLLVTNGFTSSRAVNIADGTISIATGTLALTGVVSGAGGLIVDGPGTLALSGNNTYTGGTVVNGGALSISTDNNLGATGTANGLTLNNATLIANDGFASSRPISIDDATVSVALNYTVTLVGTVSGSGGLTMEGTGRLTLDGTSTYTGGTLVKSGILQFGQIKAMPSSGTITVDSGGTLAVNAGGAGEFTNATSGAGSIGGVLSTVTFDSGSAFGIDTTDAPGGTLTYSGDITNSGIGLTKLGSGTLVLTGTNTYSGTTSIIAGTLAVGNISNFGSGAVDIYEDATLSYTGTSSATINNDVTSTGYLGSTATILYTGGATLTLSGTLTKADTNFILDAANGTIDVTGNIVSTGATGAFDSDMYITGGSPVQYSTAMNYAGATHIYGGGTLVNEVDNAVPINSIIELGSSDSVAVESGTTNYTNTYALNGHNQTIAGLTSTNAGSAVDQNSVINGSSTLSTLTITGTGTSQLPGGIFGGNGSGNNGNLAVVFNPSSSSKITLNGSNTYTGGTEVMSGTLYVNNGTSGSATGSGAFQVDSLATVAGVGTINASSITISGTAGASANVTVGSGLSTDTTNVLHLVATATTTISNANLTFNIDMASAHSNTLDVGSTPDVAFSNTTLTLNLQNGETGSNSTQYVLFTSSIETDGPGLNGSAFTGITVGTSQYFTNTATETVINGLQLAIDGDPTSSFSTGSYLLLINTGSGFDIDVVVVPEPSTWALILGGVALLVMRSRAWRTGRDSNSRWV